MIIDHESIIATDLLAPAISTMQLFVSTPPASSHCKVYPLILDCTVNDMVVINNWEMLMTG